MTTSHNISSIVDQWSPAAAAALPQKPAAAIGTAEDGGPRCSTADTDASEGFRPLQKHRKPQVFVYVCECDSDD